MVGGVKCLYFDFGSLRSVTGVAPSRFPSLTRFRTGGRSHVDGSNLNVDVELFSVSRRSLEMLSPTPRSAI